MTDVERRAAAKRFASDWQGKGDEKQETQLFWLSLLRNVCGVAQPTEVIEFEKRVEVDNSDGTTTTKYIDGLSTRYSHPDRAKGRKDRPKER